MGLDVWFREDVARLLRAAYVAGREAYRYLGGGWDLPLEGRLASGDRPPSNDRYLVLSREIEAYRLGYEAALATIGAAFGLGSLAQEPSPQISLLAGEDTCSWLTRAMPQVKADSHSRAWDPAAPGGPQ